MHCMSFMTLFKELSIGYFNTCRYFITSFCQIRKLEIITGIPNNVLIATKKTKPVMETCYKELGSDIRSVLNCLRNYEGPQTISISFLVLGLPTNV